MAQLQSPFPAGTFTQPTMKTRLNAMYIVFIVLFCAVAVASVLVGQRFISPATGTTITDTYVTDSWGPAVRAARLERAQTQGRISTDGWSLSGVVQSEPVLDGWALSGLNDD